jgi:hypothetical protein
MGRIFEASSTLWVSLGAAGLLLLLLVVSFRSRAYVFCQYLRTMTGVSLRPSEVRQAFKIGGRQGVRELFLDLLIREDLKAGPVAIPEAVLPAEPERAEVSR